MQQNCLQTEQSKTVSLEQASLLNQPRNEITMSTKTKKTTSIHTGETVEVAVHNAEHLSVHATTTVKERALGDAWANLDDSLPGRALNLYIGDAPAAHDARAVLNIMDDNGRNVVSRSEVTESDAYFNSAYVYPVLEQAHWTAVKHMGRNLSEIDRNQRARDDMRCTFIIRYDWTDGAKYYEVHMTRVSDRRYRIHQLVELTNWSDDKTLSRQEAYKNINSIQLSIWIDKQQDLRKTKQAAVDNDRNVTDAADAAPTRWA